MVSVVVVDVRAAPGPLLLETPSRAGERGQSLAHGLPRDPQGPRGGGRGQGVQDVVGPVDLQIHMGVPLPTDQHVEGRPPVHAVQVRRRTLRALGQSEGQDGAVDAPDRLHGALVVRAHDHHAVLGDQLRETAERPLDRRQVREVVQMVRLDVQDHRHGGEEVEEAVPVLAGFQDHGVPVAHAVSGVEHGQRPADHDRGIASGGHEDVGAHGGRRGLAVGPRYAQGVGIAAHDGPPALGPFVDGDLPGHGPGDLGIAVPGGSSADHQVAPAQVLGVVPDGHGDPQSPQTPYGIALGHIGSLYTQAHALERLGQRTHGHAPDAHQMGGLPRDQEVRDRGPFVRHGIWLLSSLSLLRSSSRDIIILPVQRCNRKRRWGDERRSGIADPERGAERPEDADPRRTRGVVRGRLRTGPAAGRPAPGLGRDHQRPAGGGHGPLPAADDPHGAQTRHGDGPVGTSGRGSDHVPLRRDL